MTTTWVMNRQGASRSLSAGETDAHRPDETSSATLRERAGKAASPVSQCMDLDGFLRSVQKQAWRTATLSVRDHDEALDMVQDAMLVLATRYADQPAHAWPGLFWRVLHNRLTDWHRKQNRWHKRIRFGGLRPGDGAGYDGETEHTEAWSTTPSATDSGLNDPAQLLQSARDTQRVLAAVSRLPLRQKQVFLLRAWQGMSVEETAFVLSLDPGSIKTHFHRARSRLRHLLTETVEPQDSVQPERDRRTSP